MNKYGYEEHIERENKLLDQLAKLTADLRACQVTCEVMSIERDVNEKMLLQGSAVLSRILSLCEGRAYVNCELVRGAIAAPPDFPQ